MPFSAKERPLDRIQPWRDMYTLEMGCQVIHDSIHHRPGWTREFELDANGVVVGYGSLAVAGPWKDKPTIFEFFVAPPQRGQIFEWFSALMMASGAVAIETQSNDTLLTIMLHTFGANVVCESVLFRDASTTALLPPGASVRRATADDAVQLASGELDPAARWVVEADGRVAAAGDILFHYNRPYGDIYMKVVEPFRKRGLGSFLVQELKRVCYEQGSVPSARCNPANVASRRTLQKAGFVPCGNILNGAIAAKN